MGSPRKALSQWSKGEYPGANVTEDDTARIASAVGWRPDDNAAGAALGGTPDAVLQRGVIERPDDTDEFTFTSLAGPAAFSIVPAPHGPNLDAQLQLLDSRGNVLVTANDPDGLGATITMTLAPGRYRLRVDGVGDSSPQPGYTDYASLGRYRISGSYPGIRLPDCAAVTGGPGLVVPPIHGLAQATLRACPDRYR